MAAPAAAAAGGGPCKQLTLLLLHAGGRVLLGMKKRGFGAGKLNGFGGKIEPGETILAAAVRETQEEALVTPLDAQLVGRLRFAFEGVEEQLEVHVFRATRFAGEPGETPEMAPAWFPEGELPLGRMWADDAHWLPHLLAGRRFDGAFLFRGHEAIVRHELALLPPGAPLPRSPGDVLVVGAPQGPITA